VPEWPTEKVIDDPKDVEDMVEMLRGVVVEGTGTAADIEGYKVVGKTSTAEIYDEENGGYQLGVYNIAFCGFIDDSSSDLVCYIQADNVPGDRVVTPGFKAIMESAIDRYNITSE
jgi:cell division protein FtsI (penicillin-binding protein 3)